MLDGLYAAAAGMAAQQRSFEGLANDMANLQTPGYKGVRTQFRDLLPGAGATAEFAGRRWSQGVVHATDRPLDVAIEGTGFFEVRRPDGSSALTRDGGFQLDPRGRFHTAAGELVLPGVTLPAGTSASELQIEADGTATAAGRVVGRIGVVNVRSPDGLRAAGGGLYEVTPASGRARLETAARLRQGYLEASNATPTQLVGGQRTFQFLSRVIQVQDELLASANHIKE